MKRQIVACFLFFIDQRVVNWFITTVYQTLAILDDDDNWFVKQYRIQIVSFFEILLIDNCLMIVCNHPFLQNSHRSLL